MLPETVEIYSPRNLPPLKQRVQDFMPYLESLTLQELRTLYASFTGENPPARNKHDLIIKYAEALAFPTPEAFKEWIEHLPPLARRILRWVVRDGYVPVVLIEKEAGEPVLVVDTTYAWRKVYSLKPEFRLSFLSMQRARSVLILTILPVFRNALLPWLVPPAEPADCVLKTPPAAFWSNSLRIAESFPLLCDTLRELLPSCLSGGVLPEKLVRGGFKKREIQTLRTSSGFPAFGSASAPDCAELAARFVLCMTNFNPRRPPEGQEALRKLTADFFNNKTLFNDFMLPPDRKYLEFNILTDHLSRTPGYYLEGANRELPLSRSVFQDILRMVARDGRWFDADILADRIRQSGMVFAFCNASLEDSLKIKADALDIGGLTYEAEEYDNDFNPTGVFRHELLVKPVFKAYCLLFAALGLLDISFKDPPLRRHYHGKALPISPYDCLGAIRITELGLWCLRFTTRLPPRPERNYQAIADRELYLVTVQGNSLERQVYLDRIGVKLGENRWRISPASFIAGCENKHQIDDRISRFKFLIDPQPAPHWEALFDKVLNRAGLFDQRRAEVLVYQLPEDRALAEELLSDPALKPIALRAEGKLLVVPAKNHRKFLAFLNDHGISHFG
ncbi:MAG: hypothetical protein LBU28_09165 [Spirochaetaceae bacterium]|jgi:hypothetical protein|nr:hypothetical protein [Spirochaetaceae bacterium]